MALDEMISTSRLPEDGTEFRDKPLNSSLSYKNIPYFYKQRENLPWIHLEETVGF